MSREEEASNIQVAIRVRPLVERETRAGETSIVRVEDSLIVAATDQIVFDPNDGELENQRKQMDLHHR